MFVPIINSNRNEASVLVLPEGGRTGVGKLKIPPLPPRTGNVPTSTSQRPISFPHSKSLSLESNFSTSPTLTNHSSFFLLKFFPYASANNNDFTNWSEYVVGLIIIFSSLCFLKFLFYLIFNLFILIFFFFFSGVNDPSYEEKKDLWDVFLNLDTKDIKFNRNNGDMSHDVKDHVFFSEVLFGIESGKSEMWVRHMFQVCRGEWKCCFVCLYFSFFFMSFSVFILLL
jgi:hypothetical protein